MNEMWCVIAGDHGIYNILKSLEDKAVREIDFPELGTVTIKFNAPS